MRLSKSKIVLVLILFASCDLVSENGDYEHLGIGPECFDAYGPVPKDLNGDSQFDLDDDGITNRRECSCGSNPFDATSACPELFPGGQTGGQQGSGVGQVSEVGFDYEVFLTESTGCPETIKYSLDFAAAKCPYTALGQISTPDDCHEKVGIGCMKFLQSIWDPDMDDKYDDRAEFTQNMFDPIPWGNGNEACADVLRDRSFMSRLVTIDELAPGDVFSADLSGKSDYKYYKSVNYGHAGMFIGWGRLSRSDDQEAEGWDGPRFDFFEPLPMEDPEARRVAIHSFPPAVTYSYLDDLFAEGGPYELIDLCRPKLCDPSWLEEHDYVIKG